MANITLNDFANQCQLYAHSNENYELMKECSELVLLEQYLDNPLFLMNNSEIMESSNMAFDDGYFQESASDNSLDAIMESSDDKKKNIFSKIWSGFKKLVERFANFLLKCVGKDTAEDLKDKVNKLKDDKEESEKAVKQCLESMNQMDVTIAALSSENETMSRGLKEKQAVIAKYQKMVVGKNKELSAAGAENDRLNKDNATYKGMAASSASQADAYKAMYDDMSKGFKALNVRANHETKACDPIFLIDAINKYVDAIRSGNASALTGLEKSIDAEVQRVRNDGIIINFGPKNLEDMSSKLKAAVNSAGAEEGDPSKFNGASYVTARNVYAKLNECVGATCTLISKGVKFNHSRLAYLSSFNSKVKQGENK